jgi:hypothetical protein
MSYWEKFLSGSVQQGAYVCHFTIAAPKLSMQPGRPAGYVSLAALGSIGLHAQVRGAAHHGRDSAAATAAHHRRRGPPR